MNTVAGTPYRWVVLAVSVLVNITIQLQWISMSPVSTTAAEFYGVTTTEIGWFSIIFMVVFIPLSIPAAWMVDRYGLRIAVGLGSVLVALGATVRALAGPSFGWALAGTFLSAVTPALLDAGLTIDGVLWVYAGAASVTAVLYLGFARDADRGISDATEARALELGGLRHALAQRPFQVFLAALFVALGVFNGLSTWALQMVSAIGLPEDAAEVLLESLLAGGVIGALALGAASDRSGRRVPWTAIPMVIAAPLMAAFVLPGLSMVVVGVCSFVVGFLLTGAMPVGMQYASEIAAPTPEGASSGLFQLVGQASFVVVLFMEAARTPEGGFVWSFAILGVLLAVIGLWMWRQPEPTLDSPVPGDLETADPS